jgi:hypothetical protein
VALIGAGASSSGSARTAALDPRAEPLLRHRRIAADRRLPRDGCWPSTRDTGMLDMSAVGRWEDASTTSRSSYR